MLKIISGKYRSRVIEAPSEGTVPTKNRVREAVLSAIQMEIPGARVLDLFAGSGALGIETLSRGASHCDFVDASSGAVAILKKNLATLKESHAEIIHADYLEAIARLREPYDIVFLDPPYAMKDAYQASLDALQKSGLLAEHAVVVCEYEGRIPLDAEGFAERRSKNYGLTSVDILRR